MDNKHLLSFIIEWKIPSNLQEQGDLTKKMEEPSMRDVLPEELFDGKSVKILREIHI